VNPTPNPKHQPYMTLHIMNFPTALMWICREKSAVDHRTLRQFVIDALEKATNTVGKHPNPPRQASPKKKKSIKKKVSR
jgi:uncharacterized protein (UPF0218 family)